MYSGEQNGGSSVQAKPVVFSSLDADGVREWRRRQRERNDTRRESVFDGGFFGGT
jgi:hypothetical protein